MDVKKQKDLSGFYRHLLNQTVGEEAIPDRSANKSVKALHYLLIYKRYKLTYIFLCLHFSVPASTEFKPQRFQKTQRGLHLFPHLRPMTISQVHAATARRGTSRSLGLASLRQALHTQNANTDRGRLHQGAERRRRKRGRETDIRRATEIKTGTEGGTEIETETETGEGKEMTDTEEEETTGTEGKTGTETGAEKMTEAEERGIQRGKTGIGGGRGALEKGRGKGMGKERRLGIQMKTRGRTKIEEKAVKKEEKDPEKKEAIREYRKEKEDEQREEGKQKEEMEEKVNKFAKRSTDQTLSSARDRYMARQMARSACKTYIEKEED